MDERTLEQWSNILAELRQTRSSAIIRGIQTDGVNFDPKSFFDIVLASLDETISKWYNLERRLWEQRPPERVDEAIKNSKEELESVLEFEVQAIEDELATAREQVSWLDKEVMNERSRMDAVVNELRKNYSLKVDALSMKPSRDTDEGEDFARSSKRRRAPSSSSSGVGLLIMFFVGLGLGGAATFTFWDLSKKEVANAQEEYAKVLNDKRKLENSLGMMKDVFDQLAYGKIRNIEMLKNDITLVQNQGVKKRQQAEQVFDQRKEKLLKKLPAGNRLDLELTKLEGEKKVELDRIAASEAESLRPLRQELKTIQEVLGQ